MSHSKQYKTQGFTWLEYSVNAFNGSGYADRESPEAFIDSYISYKKWKREPEAVKLANQYYEPICLLAESLIENSEVSKKPSPKQWAKYQRFCNQEKPTLF